MRTWLVMHVIEKWPKPLNTLNFNDLNVKNGWCYLIQHYDNLKAQKRLNDEVWYNCCLKWLCSSNQDVWIGLYLNNTSDCINFKYKWFDGTPVNYTSFYSGFSPYCYYQIPPFSPYMCASLSLFQNTWSMTTTCNLPYYGAICEKCKLLVVFILLF